MKALRMAKEYGIRYQPEYRFMAAQAAYWWLADNHRGQFSEEYRELSWLGRYYHPSIHESGPCQDDETALIYNALGA